MEGGAGAATDATGSEMQSRRALYLRWRPRTFAEVVDQEAITQTLRNAVARGTVAHAYLLCGPRGTGKTSIARILYKALNCARPVAGDPCGACHACEAAEAGRALDLIEIDAASNRGIDDVRALRERVRFAPSEAQAKVYIVDEAHQLTPPAWDAFLKTLEEPPPRTIFVLATTAAHRVPATIVSRCQRFDLARIPQGRIASHLEHVAKMEGIELGAGVADRLARLARGGMRDAIGMLEQVAAFAGSPVTLEAARGVLGLVRGEALRSFLDALAAQDSRRAFYVLEDVAHEGADLHQFLDEVLFDLRAALVMRAGAEASIEADFGDEERQWLRHLAEQWSPNDIAAVLRTFSDIETPGADDSHVLLRLELATATAMGVGGWGLGVGAPGVANSELSPAGARSAANEPGSASPAPPIIPEPPPANPQPPTPNSQPPSLAAIEARWQVVVDHFEGRLLDKLLLSQVMPRGLDAGVVTLEGPVDPLQLQRSEASCRRAVETALAQEFGIELRVRFAASADSTEPGLGEADPPSLAQYAETLFGGRLVTEGLEPDSSVV